MNEYILGMIVTFVTAVIPCLVAGYYIAFKGRRSLISGWTDKKVSNPELGGKIIGVSLMVLALLLGIAVCLWAMEILTETQMIYCCGFFISIPFFSMVYVNVKFGL